MECELGATNLYEFHCNDDYYFEYMADSNLDSYGNIIPIKLWNPSDKAHSLLHLILEKCPAWHFARVPAYITIIQNGNHVKESSSSFQRTFTFDNKSIYDSLTDDIATESNLVFAFDTENREIYAYDKFKEIGEDTNVFINTRNLAEKITIQENKDALINTLRVSGGDEIINNYIAAINVTGTNYISLYSNYMYEDMPIGLVNALKSYQTYKSGINDEYYGGYDVFNSLIESGKETNTILTFKGNVSTLSFLPSASANNLGHYYFVSNNNKYYVSNGTSWVICGAFTRLCSAYDHFGYLEHSMMPNVSLKNTTASIQMNNLLKDLRYTKVAIQNPNIYNSSSFTGITNSVIAYCKVVLDNRYTVESINDPANNYPRYSGNIWTGKVHVYRTTDKADSNETIITVSINDDALNFAKQKIMKALAKDSMTEVEADILAYKTSASYNQLVTYFQKYCLERLKSFYDAYENCLSVLMSLKSSRLSSAVDELYTVYVLRRDATFQVLKERQSQIDSQKELISKYETEKERIQAQADLKTYLDKIDISFWNILNSYRREADYTNNNYVSDGLETDGQILAKCKELLDTAEYELSMACQLQRTLSIDLEDLLIMPEFKPFWDKFCLYNYIRVETDQEIMKLRLVGVDIDFDSIEKLTVTFTDNLSGNGNILNNDITDVFQQISSIAPSFNFTQKQASQGKKGYNQVADWINKGLIAAKTTISNSDNNEVTFNNYGINLKDMTEEGNYGDWQIRLIGQGVYFTNDNWRTCYAAIGSIYIDGVRTTGIIAENIIGKLIAGNQLYITNESGSFELSGNTAKFSNITINYTDENGNNIKIGGATDHLISISNNGNERFYFNNSTGKMVLYGDIFAENGSFKGTIEAGTNIISPMITGGSIYGTSINIADKFKVDSQGNLTAKTGVFNGTLQGGSIIGGSINIADKFKVDSQGNLTAMRGTFYGVLSGATGIFSGELYGGSININNRFKVDSMGNLTIGDPNSDNLFRVDYKGNVKLPPSATISWSQVTGTENVANKSDIPSDEYITTITKNSITTEWLNAKGITAKNIDANAIISNNISGSTINGGKISGAEIAGLKGKIGGFTIGEESLYNGVPSFDYRGGNGVYLGTNGINCGGNFQASYDGNVFCKKSILEDIFLKGGIYYYMGNRDNRAWNLLSVPSQGCINFSNEYTATYFQGELCFGNSILIINNYCASFDKTTYFRENSKTYFQGEVFFEEGALQGGQGAAQGEGGDPLWIGQHGRIYRYKNKDGSLRKWKHSISKITDSSIDPHRLYNIKLYQFIHQFTTFGFF